VARRSPIVILLSGRDALSEPFDREVSMGVGGGRGRAVGATTAGWAGSGRAIGRKREVARMAIMGRVGC
jgi:hypothetical protein